MLCGVGLFILVPQFVAGAEDLPWGPTKAPTVITPDSDPVVTAPQSGNYGSTNGSPYDRSGNGHSNRPYSQNGSGNNYGQAYDSNRQGGQWPYENKGQYDGRKNEQYGTGDPYARSTPPAQPYPGPAPRSGPYSDPAKRGYTSDEIADAGRNFFGTVSNGLARAIEYAFQKQGRPNGYILGEEAGGAFVAGLRYGEGMLYTRSAGEHKVFWQGPSLGYDFGAEGSRTMILVYNLNYPDQIYKRYTGIDGSAYLVGGVGITFQKRGNVILAPIRSGVGVRLGANVGYLKYTRAPTWNPF